VITGAILSGVTPGKRRHRPVSVAAERRR